jgi:hypothetical protein
MTAPAGVENKGKTRKTLGFPASNDSIIFNHLLSKARKNIHISRNNPYFLRRFRRKSIKIHPSPQRFLTAKKLTDFP